jgi:hypothetical protein
VLTTEDQGRSSRARLRRFHACGILERSWFGRELGVTRFQKARAIFVAASICRQLNPFPASLGRKRSLVHVAEAMQGAAELAVGGFHEKCGEFLRALVELDRELANRA